MVFLFYWWFFSFQFETGIPLNIIESDNLMKGVTSSQDGRHFAHFKNLLNIIRWTQTDYASTCDNLAYRSVSSPIPHQLWNFIPRPSHLEYLARNLYKKFKIFFWPLLQLCCRDRINVLPPHTPFTDEPAPCHLKREIVYV